MIKECLFKKLSYKFSALTATLNLKPQELIIAPDTKCLCLSPHADDESIGMGGLISLYPKNFDLVLLTDGRKGVKDIPEDEAVKVREEEFKCALNAAGGVNDYNFLKIQDKKLMESYDIFQSIDLKNYDYIFLPNVIDQHPDHKAVSLLLKRYIEEGTKIKPDLKICFYEVWSTLGLVNAFVDISNVIESKKSMINCYKSQISQKDYVYHALGLNQFRGMLKDKKFVEAFCILPAVDFIKISNLY